MTNVKTATDTTGRGLLFPLRRVHGDFESATGETLLRSCARKVINTRGYRFRGRVPGEYRWRPDFGSQVHLLRHSNRRLVEGDAGIIYAAEAMERWEPRVRIETSRSEVTRTTSLPTAKLLRLYYQPTEDAEAVRLAEPIAPLEVPL
jgi:phage baseplate assembly protein W